MEEKRRVPCFVHVTGRTLLVILVFAALGAIVMQLWNSLMPNIFGLGAISYWQALGLAILGRLLFGGFGCRNRERRPRRPYKYWRTCGKADDMQYEQEYEEWWEKEGSGLFEEYINKKKEKAQ